MHVSLEFGIAKTVMNASKASSDGLVVHYVDAVKPHTCLATHTQTLAQESGL